MAMLQHRVSGHGKGRTLRLTRILLTIAAAICVVSTRAGELVSNGNFETNGGAGSVYFLNWNVARQSGALGGFFSQTGTEAPIVGFVVPSPPLGSFAAMSDQTGPNSTVLYQDIAIPVGATSSFSIRLFVQNQADNYFTPATLDFNSVPNQQARVDVMNPSYPLFDVGAGVLRNLFITAPEPVTSPKSPQNLNYFTISSDLSAYAGQTVRIRVAEVDNQQGLNVGVDAASIYYSGVTTSPSSPSNISVVTGSQKVIVSFSASLTNGGNAIVGYTATCTAPGQTPAIGTSPNSPVTVTGMKGGVSYSCTVVANNGTFNSAPSIATVVTPKPVDLTPILMLLLD